MQNIMEIVDFSEKTFGEIPSITCGERDEKGFCDTYVNGEKTNVRMLVFTEEHKQ